MKWLEEIEQRQSALKQWNPDAPDGSYVEFLEHAENDIARLIEALKMTDALLDATRQERDYHRFGCDQLGEKLKLATEALEFYSQHDKTTNLYGASVSQYGSDSENYRILADSGDKAREALARIKGPKL